MNNQNKQWQRIENLKKKADLEINKKKRWQRDETFKSVITDLNFIQVGITGQPYAKRYQIHFSPISNELEI